MKGANQRKRPQVSPVQINTTLEVYPSVNMTLEDSGDKTSDCEVLSC